MIAANVGAETRMNYTVHGDTVNLAARLEQLNKQHKTRTLCCNTTAGALGLDTCRLVAHTAIRGRLGEIDIYDPGERVR